VTALLAFHLSEIKCLTFKTPLKTNRMHYNIHGVKLTLASHWRYKIGLLVEGLSIYSISFTLARRRDQSHAAILAKKLQIFPTPCHLVPSLGVTPFKFMGSCKDPDTRVIQAADGENLVILACTVFDWSTRVMDKWMDRTAMAKMCYSSSYWRNDKQKITKDQSKNAR